MNNLFILDYIITLTDIRSTLYSHLQQSAEESMALASLRGSAWPATELDSRGETTTRGVASASKFIDELELDKSIAIAKDNGRQEGNLNAYYHCQPEELNLLHPFWNTADEEFTREDPTTISFNTISFTRDETDNDLREKTDFIERGEKPLCEVVKLVEATFGNKPIWTIVAHISDKFTLNAMDIIMEDILETLESVKTYYFNNCSSLRIKSTPSSINEIKSTYVLFRYIAGFPPLTFPPLPKIPTPEENRIKLAEAKKELIRLQIQAHTKSEYIHVGECKLTPVLVRQKSRSVYCSKK